MCTWVVKDDLEMMASKGNKFAKELDSKLEYPVMDLMFVSADGHYINKLNAYNDFLDVHPDVSVPTSSRKRRDIVQTDVDVFLDHVEKFFGSR